MSSSLPNQPKDRDVKDTRSALCSGIYHMDIMRFTFWEITNRTVILMVNVRNVKAHIHFFSVSVYVFSVSVPGSVCDSDFRMISQ